MDDTAPRAAETPKPRKLPDPVTLTPAAGKRIADIVAKADGATGVRLSLSVRGCSGQKYEMDVVAESKPGDLVVEQQGVRLYIERKAEMFLIGMTIDYRVEKLQSGFVFENPNETGRCGCGESVTFTPH